MEVLATAGIDPLAHDAMHPDEFELSMAEQEQLDALRKQEDKCMDVLVDWTGVSVAEQQIQGLQMQLKDLQRRFLDVRAHNKDLHERLCKMLSDTLSVPDKVWVSLCTDDNGKISGFVSVEHNACKGLVLTFQCLEYPTMFIKLVLSNVPRSWSLQISRLDISQGHSRFDYTLLNGSMFSLEFSCERDRARYEQMLRVFQ